MNKLTNNKGPIHFVFIFDVLTEYYTITDFCRSECEFLLTCKMILTEAED